MFFDSELYALTLGYLSGMIEMTLGVPQLIHNFRRGSTYGLSVTMVFMWTIGDVFKLFYYIENDSPTALRLCQLFAVGVDFSLFGQFFWYRNSKPIPIPNESSRQGAVQLDSFSTSGYDV